MRQLRVLELIKCLDVGGAETLLLERLRVADRQQCDYLVGWLDPNRTDLVPAFVDLDVPLHCFNAASAADWRWLAPLRRLIRRRRFDVVHVHSPLMAAGVRAVVRSLGAARPVLVTTEHAPVYHPLTKALDVATVRADDLVIAVSEAVRAAAVCRVAANVEVVHHGVNVDRMLHYRADREDLADALGLAAGPRVVSVANYRAEKGHAVLLAAARLVHAQLPAVHFYVAGHGQLEEWIRRQTESHRMGHYFHVLGRVPAAARLSACADVFVLCSSWEGRPVALMEALAGGTPAVVTAVGGMPGVVQDDHNGRLVPPDDPAAVAAALLSLLGDDRTRERLSTNALASGRVHDISHAARTIQDRYVELVAARHGRMSSTAVR